MSDHLVCLIDMDTHDDSPKCRSGLIGVDTRFARNEAAQGQTAAAAARLIGVGLRFRPQPEPIHPYLKSPSSSETPIHT